MLLLLCQSSENTAVHFNDRLDPTLTQVTDYQHRHLHFTCSLLLKTTLNNNDNNRNN